MMSSTKVVALMDSTPRKNMTHHFALIRKGRSHTHNTLTKLVEVDGDIPWAVLHVGLKMLFCLVADDVLVRMNEVLCSFVQCTTSWHDVRRVLVPRRHIHVSNVCASR